MIRRYLETFDRTSVSAEAIVPDLMRHLHARQHLGKAVVLCEDPAAMLVLAQKQWLKLSRVLQRRRGFETNAVEILKYTYTITQMQHATFTTETVHDFPEANVYFARPDRVPRLSLDCLTVYLAAPVSAEVMARMVTQLPDQCLLVDYSGSAKAGTGGLEPRAKLETSVTKRWAGVATMLAVQGIEIDSLTNPATSSEALDDAVDILLGVDVEFLALARDFQHDLDLARPLRSTPRSVRDEYEAFIVLAHRVETFSTGAFSPQFLRTYANDTFFLHDGQRAQESFAAVLWRHEEAGRTNIVRAMMRLRGYAERQPLAGALAMAA